MAKKQNIQTEACYREGHPKIDLYTAKGYWGSTNWWRTCRDALAYYQKAHPGHGIIKASIDHKQR